jgi:hypothetical protein
VIPRSVRKRDRGKTARIAEGCRATSAPCESLFRQSAQREPVTKRPERRSGATARPWGRSTRGHAYPPAASPRRCPLFANPGTPEPAPIRAHGHKWRADAAAPGDGSPNRLPRRASSEPGRGVPGHTRYGRLPGSATQAPTVAHSAPAIPGGSEPRPSAYARGSVDPSAHGPRHSCALHTR